MNRKGIRKWFIKDKDSDMKWRIMLFFLVYCGGGTVSAQTDSVDVRLRQIKLAENDSVRLKYADEISGYLEKIPFGQYAQLPAVQFFGYRKCVNDDAELFSWAVPLRKGQMFYNWFRFKESDRPYFQKSLFTENGEQPAWLYYDMIRFEHQKAAYFALLGWNKTRNTNQKIVQICRFEPDGSISFGHKLMRRGNSRSASLSFEYASDGSMMLKQDKKGKRIIFDHLAPIDKKYEGYYMFYGPDASYDALVLKGGEWWYQENVKQ